MADPRPLVLDVDGTFLRTDMLFECLWAGLGKDPLAVLRVCAITPRWLRHSASTSFAPSRSSAGWIAGVEGSSSSSWPLQAPAHTTTISAG